MLTAIRLSDSQDYNNCGQAVIFDLKKEEISFLPYKKKEKSILEKMDRDGVPQVFYSGLPVYIFLLVPDIPNLGSPIG